MMPTGLTVAEDRIVQTGNIRIFVPVAGVHESRIFQVNRVSQVRKRCTLRFSVAV